MNSHQTVDLYELQVEREERESTRRTVLSHAKNFGPEQAVLNLLMELRTRGGDDSILSHASSYLFSQFTAQ